MALLEDRFGPWKPVSRPAGIGWLCCYALFLLYAALDRSGFLFLDYVNLMIHEGGHLFFSWFGETIMILGGTLGELLVPLLCAAYFFFRRETPGFAFCSFWFFENFPYIGRGEGIYPDWVGTSSPSTAIRLPRLLLVRLLRCHFASAR